MVVGEVRQGVHGITGKGGQTAAMRHALKDAEGDGGGGGGGGGGAKENGKKGLEAKPAMQTTGKQGGDGEK